MRNLHPAILTRDQADAVLDDLRGRSIDAFGMAILGLYAGLRACEIFRLFWSNVDFEKGILEAFHSPARPMSWQVASMLTERRPKDASSFDYVFPAPGSQWEFYNGDRVGSTYTRCFRRLGISNATFRSFQLTHAAWAKEASRA